MIGPTRWNIGPVMLVEPGRVAEPLAAAQHPGGIQDDRKLVNRRTVTAPSLIGDRPAGQVQRDPALVIAVKLLVHVFGHEGREGREQSEQHPARLPGRPASAIPILGLDHRVEQPGPDDLERLHPHGHRRQRGVGPNPRLQRSPSLICGVSEEIIQVSITSGSASSAEPQAGQDAAGGLSASGSTGRSCRRASTGVAQEVQNQTGNGTP